MTAQRQVVLNIIKNSECHLTAEEVYTLAKEELPGIALATVYNSLSYLSANGYIRKLNINNGTVNYDKTTKPHEHCVCDKCGRITDFEIENFSHFLEERLNKTIIGYELTVHIICDECEASA